MISKKAIGFVAASAVALSMATASISAYAEDMLRPYVNVSDTAGGDFNSAVSKTRAALQAGGFEIAGEYSPYDGAHIIVVTNAELKSHAAKSEMGGFGAIQRVTITNNGGSVQVSYTNPRYMGNVYRMATDMSGIAGQLKSALGAGKEYGTADGHSAEQLREYHYKIMMPYFDDPYELGEFDSQEEAIKAVEDGLASKTAGASKVYRVDIPGKKETVFGVAFAGTGDNECSGDKYIMDRIDGEHLRGTAHLPYEMLVTDGMVRALHPKFRIALSFPDLSMMAGDYTFMKIMCAPGAIEDAFLAIVGEN